MSLLNRIRIFLTSSREFAHGAFVSCLPIYIPTYFHPTANVISTSGRVRPAPPPPPLGSQLVRHVCNQSGGQRVLR